MTETDVNIKPGKVSEGKWRPDSRFFVQFVNYSFGFVNSFSWENFFFDVASEASVFFIGSFEMLIAGQGKREYRVFTVCF
jgi:hypothetical protein